MKKNRVKVDGPNPEALWKEVQANGGVSVFNDQIVKAGGDEDDDDDDGNTITYTFHKNGDLKSQNGGTLALLCTSTDAWGNSAVVEVMAPTNEDEDDLDKKVIENLATSLTPSGYELLQNYPNPFNPSTTIEYAIPEPVNVQIEIYNTMGHKIKTLVSKKQVAGSYSVHWDATNDYGSAVASGIYYVSIRTENFYQVNKMLYMK